MAVGDREREAVLDDLGVAAHHRQTAHAAELVDAGAAEATEAPYGEGSHAVLDDGSQPEGFPIKGNADSMLYHVPDSRFYEQTVAEVWFDSAESAEAAGFQLPPSQRDDEDTESN